jgi:GT2 family glycosyltransferase
MNDQRRPLVSVGILTRNRIEAVQRAIASVYADGWNDFEIVLVDNFSTDGTTDVIQSKYPGVRVVKLPHNLGCPGGRNHVFVNCRGRYIICLDDDGFLEPGSISQAVRTFEVESDVGIVCFRQQFIDGGGRGKIVGDGRRCDVGNFSGGLVAFRSEMLAKIGYYPPDYFLFQEEGHLAIRALDAGYRILAVPDIIMWHPEEGGSGTLSTTWDYYRFRNPILLAIELFPAGMMCKRVFWKALGGLVAAVRRKSVPKYLRAIASVAVAGPRTFRQRRPASREAVRFYLQNSGRVEKCFGEPDAT